MTIDARADTRSCTLRVAASESWSHVQAVAEDNGLTLEYLVDVRPGRTVGETLSAPAWLPPLWPPHTVRGACVALSGTGLDGDEYVSVVSPRTASGPDLRAFFLEAGGAFGEITAATMRCERLDERSWYRPADRVPPVALQSIANRFGSVVTVHGDPSGAVVRVRGATALADVARRELESLGLTEAAAPERAWEPRAIAVVPWSSVDAAMEPVDTGLPSFLGGGPTHIAVGIAAPKRGRKAASAWAADQVAAAPAIGRVVLDVGESAPEATRIRVGEVVS